MKLLRTLLAHPVVLLAIGLCFVLFALFGELVDEVLEGESHAIDERILLLFRDAENPRSPLGPAWLEEAMRDFTALGGTAVLTSITLFAAIYLAATRHKGHAVYLLAAVTTGTLLSSLLKIGFDRPRPELVPHDSIVSSASFPSGHSLVATVVYLTLGVILAEVESRRSMKVYVLGVAIFIAAVVGVSRVYLGVHWPSDVAAGWLVGAGWALMFWLLARYLQSRRVLNIEADDRNDHA